jgi:hypothetical protein
MSGSVRSRKFCCFLPVRLGVFVLSLLAMVGGSFTAAAGWIQVSQLKQAPLDKSDKIALLIHSAMFTILSLVSVFGFIGAIIKNRRTISMFAVALAVHLGFSIASGIFTLVSLFKQDSSDAMASCLSSSTDATTEGCKSGIATMKGLMVAIYIITWLIQLYFYFIVERYLDQLDDEEMAKNTVVIPRTMQEANAQQVTTYGGFAPPYPFTEPRQAFGASRGQDPSNNV